MSDSWVKRSINQLRDRAGALFSANRQAYLQNVVQQHRFLNLQSVSPHGLHNVALERVFVQADLAPKSWSPSLNGYHSSLAPAVQQHTIWHHLDTARSKVRCLVVTGPSGCGKTTLLKAIALTLAAGAKKHRANSPPPPRRLPILLNLPRYAEPITSNPNLTLAQALLADVFKGVAPGREAWLAEQLERGRCLILLDGIDEIASYKQRSQVVAWLERQFGTGSGNRYLLTARSLDNIPQLSEERLALEVQPLTYGQITRFVNLWGQANGLTGAQIDDLLQQFAPPSALFKLIQSPLLLTMMVTVYPFLTALPQKRVELYTEYCQLLLTQNQNASEIDSPLDRARRQQLLRRLAYELVEREQSIMTPSEAWELVGLHGSDRIAATRTFTRIVRDSRGLLIQYARGRYGFAHLSLQQYLAATYLREEHRAEVVSARIAEPWWQETLRFYAVQSDASSTLVACLDIDKPAIPMIQLALAGLDEASSVQPELRLRVDSVLDQALEDQDTNRRRQAAELLLANRLREMRAINEGTLVSDSLVTNAEYQLFLDDQRRGGVYRQPDHWLSVRYPRGQSRRPVTGVRPSDALAFCDWLTERERGFWHFRLPSAASKEEVAGLGSLNYWIRSIEDRFVLNRTRDYDSQDEDWQAKLLPTLTRALQPDRDLTFTREILQVLAQKVALARTLGLARIFDLKCAFDFSRVPAADQTMARNLVLVRALSLGYQRSQNLASSFDRNSTRNLSRSRQMVGGLNLSQLLDVELDLTRAYALALDRQALEIFDVPLNIKATWSEIVRFLHWYIRVVTLIVASKLTIPFVTQQVEPCLVEIRSMSQIDAAARAEIQRLINAYIELYVDFVVLEERIQGNMPAFEGIRLVRERL